MFTFALVSTLCCLAEIWQLSHRGAIGGLEVEFKFQRCSCKLSFLLPPHRQSAPPRRACLQLGWDINGISNKLLSVGTAICKSVCHSQWLVLFWKESAQHQNDNNNCMDQLCGSEAVTLVTKYPWKPCLQSYLLWQSH